MGVLIKGIHSKRVNPPVSPAHVSHNKTRYKNGRPRTMYRNKKAAAAIYGWDRPLLTFTCPGFDCGSRESDLSNPKSAFLQVARRIFELIPGELGMAAGADLFLLEELHKFDSLRDLPGFPHIFGRPSSQGSNRFSRVPSASTSGPTWRRPSCHSPGSNLAGNGIKPSGWQRKKEPRISISGFGWARART